MLFVGLVTTAAAQLSGPKSIPGDYATIADAITDLNAQGVGSGGVTFNVAAGHTETIAAVLSLTATGTVSDPIVFQKSGGGANPLVTSYTGGTGTPGSAVQDGIWRLVGSDYVTIDGIDLVENAANVANPATMEYGYALYKASATDGCQNVTIQNCTITLNRINNAGGTGPSVDGSKGINVTNALPTTATTNVTVTSAAGSNSNNKFYANVIQNCNIGVALIGFADVSPFTFADTNNDVGGAALATGNNIRNWGGGGTTSPAAGIRTLAQYGLNLSYNTINNNDGGGVNHATTLRGIFNNTATSASATISNNTITVRSAATTSILTAIDNVAGATAAGNTINITNNTITGCTYATATSGAFTGIINNLASAATVNINNNVLSSNATNATSGTTNLIQNSGVVTVALNVNNNNINGWTYNAVTSGTFNGINCSASTVTAAVSITGNDFQSITHSLAGSAAHNYITYSNPTSATANINSNTFTNLNVNTTGSVNFIVRTGSMTATGVENCNSNQIVTAFNKGGAGGTVFFFNANASSVNGSKMTQNLNNFSNVTVTGATTISGWSNTEGASASSGPEKQITNNTFNSITGGTSAITGISVNFSGPSTNVVGNTISNVSSAGAITGMTFGSSNQGPLTVRSNTIDPISSTGGAVTGIANSSPAATTIRENNIFTLSTSAPAAVQGITSSAGTTVNIFRNKIYDLSGSNLTSSVNGMLVSGGTTVNVFNNLIGDLRNTASGQADGLRGISLTSTTALSNLNVSFNTIYLNASSTGAPFGSSGIFHTSNATATTATLTMRDNIITNLSTPSGTGLTVAYRRSSSVLANYSTASNNNLLYAGTPSASNLIFFDGSNSDQTIGAFRSRVSPADAASVTENPPFLSTTGSSADFLHIDPSIATQIESGGVTVAGITDDYDGQTRNVTTPDIGADEGNFILADLSGPAITYTPLANTTSTTTRSFTNVTVTDPSGVDGTLGTRPRVYYKKSTDANTVVDNTNGTNGWKYVEANGSISQFDFTIDQTLIFGGTVAIGDVIQYFVVAQDLAGPPNVGINSGTFAVQPASVALTAAAFPLGGTIRSYTIVDVPLNGDYTVGVPLFNQVAGTNLTFERRVQRVMREVLEPVDPLPQVSGDKSTIDGVIADQVSWKRVVREVEEVTWVPMSNGKRYEAPLYMKRFEHPDLPSQVGAGVYATITAAVADLNLRGVSGPVRFLLIDSSYPTETFPITVNVTSGDVPNATNTVTIRPATGVTSTVSGASPSNAIFKVFNTNYITIDGSNSGGTSRDLTIENTSATSPLVVWFGSSGTTPITNETLKNCIVRNGATTSSAVVTSDGTVAGNPGFFSNVEIRNNKIDKAFIGCYSNGGTVPQNGSSLTYADNELNTSGANAIRLAGLYMQGVNGATVSGNTVANFEAVNGENDVGIWLASGTINATVSGNSVSNLNYTGTSTFSPIGINVTPVVAASNNVVRGNTVSGFASGGSSSTSLVAGISVTGASGGVTIEKNSVQNIGNTNPATWPAVGINVNGGNNIVVRNNFVARVYDDQTAGTGAFTPTFGATGIRVNAGTGHQVYFNSVHLYGAMAGATSTNLVSALAVFTTTSTGCDIRNNILSNQMTGGNPAGTRFVDINLPSGGTSAMNLTLNNSAYFEGTSPQARMAVVGTTFGSGEFTAANFNPGATTPATNFRSYTSTLSVAGTNDNASLATSVAPTFTSDTDLHILTNTFSPVSNTGVSIGSVTDDYDGDLRTVTPDIGADEFTSFTLITSVVGGGSIQVVPLQTAYALGTSVTLTAVPDSCQEFVGWSGDASGNTNPLKIVMDSDKSITATFATTTYTITATAGVGGSISPSGAVSVACGTDTTFTITPDPCYQVADVLVDNVSVGPVTNYTFTDVQANHTIDASFSIIPYTITATAGIGGSISPSGAVLVSCGTDTTFTITPDACYQIADVLVDNVSVGPVTSYTFTDVQANHTIDASFMAAPALTITASAGPGGTISPSGAVSVACGTDTTFTITPDPCYQVADVLVDNVSVGPVTSYTFTDVQANHTIDASFMAAASLTITASAGPGGTINPSGAVSVACGADTTFTITPDACHVIADVLVDNVSVGPVTSYTFTTVQANHTIDASFSPIAYTITASAGANGTISPSGAVSVDCSSDTTFTITPDPCYEVADVLVDNVSVGPVTSYTFTNVQGNHTIAASFTLSNVTLTVNVVGNGTVAVVVEGGEGGAPRATFQCGTSVALTALPATGWLFDGWSGDASGDDNPLIVVMDANKTITATFTEGPTSVATNLLAPGEWLGVFPNPSTVGRTRVLFRAASAGYVDVSVFDVTGQLVKRLSQGVVPAGDTVVAWAGRDENGIAVAAGTYFVRMTDGTGATKTKRIVMIR